MAARHGLYSDVSDLPWLADWTILSSHNGV